MQIKCVIIVDIHYINFLTFNISTLLFFFSLFTLPKLGGILYTHAFYMPSNFFSNTCIQFFIIIIVKENDDKFKTFQAPCIKYGDTFQPPSIKYGDTFQPPSIKYRDIFQPPCIKYGDTIQPPCIKYGDTFQPPPPVYD